MKITFFNLNRLSFYGGAEKYIVEVGTILAKRGNQVFFVGDCRFILKFYIILGIVLGLNPPHKFFSLIKELNRSPTINLRPKIFFKLVKLNILSFLPLTQKRRDARKSLKNSDIVLAKNEIMELILLSLLGTGVKNKYLVVFSSLRYPDSVTLRAKVHNFVYNSRFYKVLVRRFGKVIVSNRQDEKIFKEKFGLESKRIFYVPYGLNEEYFAKKDEIICSSKFSILFVGRMEEQKGICFLKDIIDRINLGKPKLAENIVFNIAGNGPLEEVVRHLGERYKNVNYLGKLEQKELRNLYLLSDLLIITSKWETFSYVCLEAQACGLPVVAFDVPGPSDIIRGHTGKLITLGDVQSFIDAIFYYFRKKDTNFKDNLVNRFSIASESKKIYNIDKTASLLERIRAD